MTVEDSYDGPHLQGQPAHERDLASPNHTQSWDLLHACAYSPQKGSNTDVHVVLIQTENEAAAAAAAAAGSLCNASHMAT